MSEFINPMASHNHQPPECEWCKGWCGHLIPDDKCEQCETRRPIYTLAQVQEIIEGIAVRVEELNQANSSNNYITRMAVERFRKLCIEMIKETKI